MEDLYSNYYFRGNGWPQIGEFAPTRTFKGHTPADKKAAAAAYKPEGDKK